MGVVSGKKGKRGEDEAVSYLTLLGYKILERNFYARVGEIDIVARDGDEIVFVEVKWRGSLAFGSAKESVDYGKLKRIMMAAERFCQIHGLHALPQRIDVISIDSGNLEHVKGISFN